MCQSCNSVTTGICLLHRLLQCRKFKNIIYGSGLDNTTISICCTAHVCVIFIYWFREEVIYKNYQKHDHPSFVYIIYIKLFFNFANDSLLQCSLIKLFCHLILKHYSKNMCLCVW